MIAITIVFESYSNITIKNFQSQQYHPLLVIAVVMTEQKTQFCHKED